MARCIQVLCVVLVGGLALTSLGALPTDVDEFDEFNVFVEINATDGDAGFQGILDGGPWKWARVTRPAGRAIFRFTPERELREHGAAEIQWESNEPQFGDFPLEDFLDLFKEGTYTAKGKTTDDIHLRSNLFLVVEPRLRNAPCIFLNHGTS